MYLAQFFEKMDMMDGGAWWPGSKCNDYRAKVMGWPGITSKTVEKSYTPLTVNTAN